MYTVALSCVAATVLIVVSLRVVNDVVNERYPNSLLSVINKENIIIYYYA